VRALRGLSSLHLFSPRTFRPPSISPQGVVKKFAPHRRTFSATRDWPLPPLKRVNIFCPFPHTLAVGPHRRPRRRRSWMPWTRCWPALRGGWKPSCPGDRSVGSGPVHRPSEKTLYVYILYIPHMYYIYIIINARMYLWEEEGGAQFPPSRWIPRFALMNISLCVALRELRLCRS